MLLAPPPELQGMVPNMQEGAPWAAAEYTQGTDWLWPLNFILPGEWWPASYVPGPLLNATGEQGV